MHCIVHTMHYALHSAECQIGRVDQVPMESVDIKDEAMFYEVMLEYLGSLLFYLICLSHNPILNIAARGRFLPPPLPLPTGDNRVNSCTFMTNLMYTY